MLFRSIYSCQNAVPLSLKVFSLNFGPLFLYEPFGNIKLAQNREKYIEHQVTSEFTRTVLHKVDKDHKWAGDLKH